MNILTHLFIAPLEFGFMRDGLLVVLLIGVTAAVLSCLLVVRRQALMGDAISHCVLIGVVLGWLVAKDEGVLLGALVAGVLSGSAMTFIERAGIKLDAAMGVVATAAFALGLAIISIVKPTGIDLFHVLLGNVLGVSTGDLKRTIVVCALVLATVTLLFRGLQFWSFDPVAAQVAGLPTRLLHYVFTALLSATVVVAIQAVGILLVIAMLVTPGATAWLLTRRLAPMMGVAAVIGAFSGVGGLYGSYHLDVASGPAIVLVASGLFLLALLLAPRRGVLWRRWAQQRTRSNALDDDLLKDALIAEREEGLRLGAALLSERLGVVAATSCGSLARLARAGLMQWHGDRLALTPKGERRATELVRTQRLLETYLHDVEAVPIENIRSKADEREHSLSADAIEAMAQLLGDPRKDPHGHPIPQRSEGLQGLRRIAGQSLAVTAPGQGGRVSMISDDRADLVGEMVRLGILPDAHVTVLAREVDGLRVRIDQAEPAGLSSELARRVFVLPRPRIVLQGADFHADFKSEKEAVLQKQFKKHLTEIVH